MSSPLVHEVPRGCAITAPSGERIVAGGHDILHTSNLPLANRTSDGEITILAMRENRIVVTKDTDFVTTFLLKGVPPKLLLISTGNISNDLLCGLIKKNLVALEKAFLVHNFVELGISTITIHS